MKRRDLTIAGGICLAAALLILLLFRDGIADAGKGFGTAGKPLPLPSSSPPPGDQPSPSAAQPSRTVDPSPSSGASPPMELAFAEYQRSRQTVAVFHGKVVDQDGEPVPDARVHYTRKPFYDENPGMVGPEETSTDAKGLFSIRKTQAPELNIFVQIPPGFHPPDDPADASKKFIFFEPSPEFMATVAGKYRYLYDHHVADPANPVVFKLKRIVGSEPMIHRRGSKAIDTAADFLVGTAPAHTLHVVYWPGLASKPVPNASDQWQYDWGFEISIPGGGLVARQNTESTTPSSFLAPEGGYQEKIRHEFQKTMPAETYKTSVTSEYFARFQDGTHARIMVDMSSTPADPFVVVKSWFNPSGSRSTEFDESKQIKP